MAREVNKSPKKLPVQERSKATVSFILDAANRAIEINGLPKLRINDVAKLAGVSVGSIYQYFPTKEALLAAWEEHRFQRLFEAAVARARANHEANRPPEEAIFELALLGIELFSNHGGHLDMTADRRKARVEERLRMIDAAADIFAFLLEARVAEEPRLAGKDLRLMCKVAIQTIVVFAIDLVSREQVERPDYPRYVAQLVTSFLLGPAPPELAGENGPR
jgi:AcrR family transcriptional regulator